VRLRRVGGDGLELFEVHSGRDADAEYLDAGVLRHVCLDHRLLSLHVRLSIGDHDDQARNGSTTRSV